MQKVKVAINIPSGKLICGNDFRKQYPNAGGFYVNETVGIKQTIESYGKIGLFHGFCGNTCPTLFLNGNNSINSCIVSTMIFIQTYPKIIRYLFLRKIKKIVLLNLVLILQFYYNFK